ncbi:MAG: dTDP-4-dehydrorhamnose 3,5-epimerase [Verrucomicrobiaceae bacterium]|nr:MAG: dTDP-4-dehydrorhamnose 3,5-epimerase [Verrucomicrobiaceae bacterium]
MIFQETSLAGAYIVELDRRHDMRGFFARAFCGKEMLDHGIRFEAVQANISHSSRKGTLRGMHYQGEPVSEPKFIRCIRGAVWDVIIDMRPGSPTYLQHIGVELSADNGRALYVPDRFAHGNQALADETELLYLMGGTYTPGFEKGVRYDDPGIGIDWPVPVTVVDQKDRNWPLLGTPGSANT